MKCKKVLSRLHAYQDGELPGKLAHEMEEHFAVCPSCRSQVEHIRNLGDLLDDFTVPPLPQEFAARVMAVARNRVHVAKEKKPIFPLGWQPVRWVLDMPFSMRMAACAMVLLACLLGIFMSKELFLSKNSQLTVADAENVEGFEWFSPTPPASLGSAYVTLAWTMPEEQDRP